MHTGIFDKGKSILNTWLYYWKTFSTLSNKNFKNNSTFIQRNSIVTRKAIDLPVLRQLSYFYLLSSNQTFVKKKIKNKLTLVISFSENAESLLLIGILGVTGVRGDWGELFPGGGDSSVGRYPGVGVLGENWLVFGPL